MKLTPVLLIAGALGGASFWGAWTLPEVARAPVQQQWQVARLHRGEDATTDLVVTISLACERGCRLDVAVSSQPTRG